jgi:alpha-glucosidase
MIRLSLTKCLLLIAVAFMYCCTAVAQVKKVYKTSSPDKATVFEAGINGNGRLVYRMLFNEEPVVEWSALGIKRQDGDTSNKFKIAGTAKTTVDETFAWVFGERDSVKNSYNQLLLRCVDGAFPYNIVARVYNGSIAFRYQLSTKPSTAFSFTAENTGFQLPGKFTLYQYNQESVFTPTGIDTFTKTCDLPATLANGKFYISIGEAGNSFFTKAELKKSEVGQALQVAYLRDKSVTVYDEWLTPWRTVSVARTAIGLHTFSDLAVRLNPAPEIPLAPSIKPGKLIRAQLTTQSGLDCIDFAAKNNFQYIMYDAGWYGAEFRSSSDPTQVIPAIDMPKVIAYGKEKNIGVVLYVNYVGLKAKLDTLLPLYKQWGVAGLKFGFVDGLTQNGLVWLGSAIRKVSEYGFILNIHDNYKPTGLSRTYPALLTQEGIRGDENSPDAFHTTTLPFTRYLAGAADFTYCYPNPKNSFGKNIKVSKAQQLALTVVYYSPLQAIFWYGQPQDYTNEEEIEFFKHVPTVWDETIYLAGDIGEGISVARKNGDTWFVGSAAGLEDWSASFPLNFLEEGKKYRATIYEDNAGTLLKRTLELRKSSLFDIQLNAKEGQAVIIRAAY